MSRRPLLLAALVVACSGPSPDAPPPSAYGPFELSVCDGRYTIATTVGAQSLSLLFDTGSAQLGVASTLCDDSCTGNTLYSPGPSATDLQETSSASYGGATSSFSGELYRDSVRFTDMTASAVPMAFVAMTHQHWLLVPPLAACPGFVIDGILGAGPQEMADPGTDAFMTQFAAANPGNADSFTMQLCPTTGKVWFGSYDASAATGPMQYTPLSIGPIGYTVAVDHVALDDDGARIELGPIDGGLTIDSGAQEALTLVPAVYEPVTAAIMKLPRFREIVSSDPAFFDQEECVPAPSADLAAELPDLTLSMPSADGGTMILRVPALGGWLRSDQSAMGPQVCANIANGYDILGVGAMTAFLVQIDRPNQRVGFAPGRCAN